MSWRKWLVRGLVFSVATGIAAGFTVYHRLTSPDVIRRQVIDRLESHLVGARVSVGSADMRLLEGIKVSEVRMTRRDDPSRAEFAYIPAGVIYHDKEQLRFGRLVIRKIELKSPRLRIVRGADGRWNLSGILGPFQAELIPTLEIQKGTIYFEDHVAAPGMPALEIDDVDMTLVNDPLLLVHFRGSGKSPLAQAVQIKGSWQRRTDETTLQIQADGIPVGPSLMRRMGAYSSDVHANLQHLKGTAGMKAELCYRPGTSQPWSHDVWFRIWDGKFSHAKLPLPLEQMQAVVHCLDGQMVLESLKAVANGAEVEMSCSVGSPVLDADLEGTIRVQHLALTPAVFERLPPSLQKLNNEYAPTGPIILSGRFARKRGQWAWHCTLRPEDMSIAFYKFPYPVQHVTGVLEEEVDPERQVDRVDLDLAGMAGGRQVFLKGQVQGDGPTAGVAIRIWGNNLALNETLMTALPPPHQKLARSFHPAGGVASFEASIDRPVGSHEFINRYRIRFQHVRARYDVFPYPVEEVSGLLDIQPERWEFTDFRGVHQGGEIRTQGWARPTPEGDRLEISIQGIQVRLDQELESALGGAAFDGELKQTWDAFSPTGRMDFSARVTRLGEATPEVEVTVRAKGCSIRPSFFPYALNELTGTLHYARRWVTLENCRARHGPTTFSVERGRIFLKPQGGVWADLESLHGEPVLPEPDLLQALPPMLRKMCLTLHLKDPVRLETRLTLDAPRGSGSDPDIFWDGELTFAGAHLQAGVALENLRGTAACRGRYNGRELEGVVGNLQFSEATLFHQVVRDVQGEFEVKKETPGVFAIRGLRARIYGGEINGPIRIEFGPRVRYELYFLASQIRLEEFGRQNLGDGATLSGLATARLHLAGQGDQLEDLAGDGTVEIPNGRLGSLPLLLDLLKFLGLRLPDGTAFDEAYANFSIRGNRVAISRIDLFGNSISLRGHGEMNLDGTDVNLDFYGVWARIMQYLPPVIKDLPPYVSQHLLKIRMRGKMGNVQITTEPVPAVTEPIWDLVQRMRGRSNK